MSYYLEIWLEGSVKDYFRKVSTKNENPYHPHITLVRPFEIKTSEKNIKNKIINLCKGKPLISFNLEGKGNFDNKIHYIPLTDCTNLLRFNYDLEKLLENDVEFDEKINDEKILHATVNSEKEIDFCPKIRQTMSKLTVIRNKKIWFSYDFVDQKILNREESLGKSN
jgi:hypothetical protein